MSSNEIQTFKFPDGWGRRPTVVPIDGVYPEPFGELTDLEFAASHGRIGIIKVLLETGADVNAKSRWRGFTPLMTAASSGQAEAVQFLINFGAELEAKDLLGRTCLFNAIESRHKKTVQVLIDSGANVNMSDDWGITPLMCAAVGKSIESVKILLAASADVNATDTDGNTVLDHMRYKRSSIPFVGDFFTSEHNKEMIQLLEEAKLKSSM